MKTRLSQLTFFLFILVHLGATFLAWQIWPLTNYPMFSRPTGPFHDLKTIYIESVYPRERIRWTRQMLNTGNPRDLRLLGYLDDQSDKEKLDQYLRFRARRLHFDTKLPQKIEVLQVTFTLDRQQRNIFEKSTVIREVSLYAD